MQYYLPFIYALTQLPKIILNRLQIFLISQSHTADCIWLHYSLMYVVISWCSCTDSHCHPIGLASQHENVLNIPTLCSFLIWTCLYTKQNILPQLFYQSHTRNKTPVGLTNLISFPEIHVGFGWLGWYFLSCPAVTSFIKGHSIFPSPMQGKPVCSSPFYRFLF